LGERHGERVAWRFLRMMTQDVSGPCIHRIRNRREAAMDWKQYFEHEEGLGILATSDADGNVNLAVYSKPHVLEDGTLAFGMTDRLTHANLQSNAKAAYAFTQPGYRGVRLYLERAREEDSGPVLEAIRRRADAIVGPGTGEGVQHLVAFRVTKSLNLVGPGPV
jgi:hypothetical protein